DHVLFSGVYQRRGRSVQADCLEALPHGSEMWRRIGNVFAADPDTAGRPARGEKIKGSALNHLETILLQQTQDLRAELMRFLVMEKSGDNHFASWHSADRFEKLSSLLGSYFSRALAFAPIAWPTFRLPQPNVARSRVLPQLRK